MKKSIYPSSGFTHIATSRRGARTRRKSGAKKRRSSSRTSISRLRLAATALLTLLFIAGLYALNTIELNQPIAPATKPSGPAEVVDSQPDTDKANNTQANTADAYSFYSKLKDFEVRVPEDTGYDSDRPSVKGAVYLIQAGSFRTPQQAEQRLVELTLLGLEPTVSRAVNDSGNRWYRVRLGPFEKRSQMASTRAIIMANGIEAMVMQRSE